MKTTISAIPIIALLIKWSGIGITEGRGKIGGTVLSKSKAGATARVKVTPINRRSIAQSYVRSLFAGMSRSFSSLTAAQIAAWNAAAAAGFTVTNIFGDAIQKSGKALYVGLSLNLLKVNGSPNDSPPSPTDTPDSLLAVMPTSDVSSANLFANIKFSDDTNIVPADNAVAVFATPRLSNGVSFVKSQYRQIGYISAAGDTTAVNLLTLYTDVFGVAPSVGDKVLMMVSVVNTLSGLASPPWNAQITITA